MNHIRQIRWWLVARDTGTTLAITYILAFVAVLLKVVAELTVASYKKLDEIGYYAGLFIGLTLAGSLGRQRRLLRLCHLSAVVVTMWVALAACKIVYQADFTWLKWCRVIGASAVVAFMGGAASLILAPPHTEDSEEKPQQTSTGNRPWVVTRAGNGAASAMNDIRGINWWHVARDAAGIFGISLACSVMAALLNAVAGLDVATYHKLLSDGLAAAFIIGFTLAGCLGRRPGPERLYHLCGVAVALWVLAAAAHAAVPQVSFSWVLWFRGIGNYAMYAFIGGGTSLMLTPPQEEEAIEQPQQTPAGDVACRAASEK